MKMNKLRPMAAPLLITFLFLSANLTMAPPASAEQGKAPSQPHFATATVNLSYPGFILASRNAQLAFRVSGPLIRVAVKPGDMVRKDQVLMQIDPRDFEDNLRVLEARLAGARSQEKRADRDFARAQTLFDQQVSSNADFDRAKSAFDSALSGVQSIQAQLQIARHQLKDTSLRAPYDGVITTQDAENFEMVRAGQVVLGIQDISNLEVEIKIPENEIARHPLQKGQPVSVELSAIPGRLFAAELNEWNTAADPVTRTYALRFSFPAPADVQVLPGMTAEVSVKSRAIRPSSYFQPAQKSNLSVAPM